MISTRCAGMTPSQREMCLLSCAGSARLVIRARMKFAGRYFVFLSAALFIATSTYGQGNNPAVEQSRLYPRTIPPNAGNISAEGTNEPTPEGTAEIDESFGKQQILKTEEPIPSITISAGTSFYFTSNVALTHENELSDGFFVGEAAFSWTPHITPELQFQIGAGASIFRYFETHELDFSDLTIGTGLAWTPRDLWGVTIFGRYDFIELINRHGDEILQDHEFSLALQKVIVLGRSHSLSFGLVGTAGISDPFVQQRDQVGFAAGYHIQLARQFGADIGYRISGYFYNESDREDLNQVLSLGLHYNFNALVSVNTYISAAKNHSNVSAFKYDALSAGGGFGLLIRF
jgi:hypothetical protein